MANLELREQPWVTIFGKTPPNPLDTEATREQEEEMVKVVECLKNSESGSGLNDCNIFDLKYQ